jgi:hypothetical protein
VEGATTLEAAFELLLGPLVKGGAGMGKASSRWSYDIRGIIRHSYLQVCVPATAIIALQSALLPASRSAFYPVGMPTPSHQIVLLIDALDEGDPPEQQVSGFKGSVMAGGNQALKLVVTCLAAKLPANVR